MTAFKLFKIKPEERIQSLIALAVIVLLNALFIYRMHGLFMQEGFGLSGIPSPIALVYDLATLLVERRTDVALRCQLRAVFGGLLADRLFVLFLYLSLSHPS